MTTDKIVKAEVHEALIKMERVLFDGKSSEDTVPSRLEWVFTAAYIKNYYPPESEILIRSYKLLQEKGYYYDF